MSERCDPDAAHGVKRALREANGLVTAAEAFAVMMDELGGIELPPAAVADPAEIRAIASLYLAASLEAAGLIAAAEDLVRLARSGALRGDFGQAAPLIDGFWRSRNERVSDEERVALFRRLFGIPPGPVDAAGGANIAFEEQLLDLCEGIITAADEGDGPHGARLRSFATHLASNLNRAAGDMTLFLAREVVDNLGSALSILNHADVRAMLSARTLWEAIGAIDRRLGRPIRATLTHLRRGRAGMTVLAWLADAVGAGGEIGRLTVEPDDPVVDAAVDWLDETLELMNEAAPAAGPTSSGRDDWASLAA